MSDFIRVIDLEVFARIGVPDEEQREAQRLLISLELECGSLAKTATTDDLTLTVNYYDVAQLVKKRATERPRRLLETLAEDLAAEILRAFPVKKITLEIKKFILPDARHVAVSIERTRSNP
jgi:phosphoglycolate phosphatase/dihydroneopterin aldolase